MARLREAGHQRERHVVARRAPESAGILRFSVVVQHIPIARMEASPAIAKPAASAARVFASRATAGNPTPGGTRRQWAAKRNEQPLACLTNGSLHASSLCLALRRPVQKCAGGRGRAGHAVTEPMPDGCARGSGGHHRVRLPHPENRERSATTGDGAPPSDPSHWPRRCAGRWNRGPLRQHEQRRTPMRGCSAAPGFPPPRGRRAPRR